MSLAEDLKKILKEPDSIPLLNKMFSKVLYSDRKKMELSKGYPNSFCRFLHNLSLKTGIPFVNKRENDYTFDPLINKYSYLFGGKNSEITRILKKLNMMIFGGIAKGSRYKNQLALLESYKEYSNTTITLALDYMIEKDQSLYTKKILTKFKENRPNEGPSLKTFIVNNSDYFKEIAPFFMVKDRSENHCLNDAIEDLKARIKSNNRGAKLAMMVGVTSFECLALIVALGVQIIPMMVETFESDISNFSPFIRNLNKLSMFIVHKWYITLIIAGLIYALTKTTLFKVFWGMILLKMPVTKDYVINSELSKFLSTYVNLIRIKSTPEAYEDSLVMVKNYYLLHVMRDYVKPGSRNNMKDYGIPFYKTLQSNPYIPKQYIDIIAEKEINGNPEKGITEVIEIMDKKLENLGEVLFKSIQNGVWFASIIFAVSVLIFMVNDLNIIMEISNQEFINQMRQ